MCSEIRKMAKVELSLSQTLRGPSRAGTMDVARTLLIAALIFVPLEHLLGVHERATFRTCRLVDLGCAVINGIVTAPALKLALVVLVLGAQACAPAALRDAVARQPFWFQAPEVIALGDIGIYLAHRLFHRPALWRFHAVHHSAEAMDWLVAFRNHPVEWAAFQAAALLPLHALGYSTGAIGLYVLTFSAQSLLVHANIRLPLGPLRHVVVGPDFHHWHHANQREAYDRNFAAQLALWDCLFGTLHLPAGCRPVAFGTDERLPRGLVGMLTYPFRRTGRVGDRPARPAHALRRALSGS